MWLLWTLLLVISFQEQAVITDAAAAFAPSSFNRRQTGPYLAPLLSTRLHAKPMRLKENVDGVVYVNDKCINCAACSGFAPATFRRSDTAAAHVVYQQPSLSNTAELQEARAALAACPVAAIRIETLAERRHGAPTADAKKAVENGWTLQDEQLVQKMALRNSNKDEDDTDSRSPFPRPFLDNMDDVHWLGHHNDKSFGAIPYLLRTTRKGKNDNDDETIWIMIDTPRFSKSAIAAVESLTGPSGPDYLFLTHVDDTADHGKWTAHYNNNNDKNGGDDSSNLKRIFHAGDLGKHNWLGDLTLENVEVLLQPNDDNGRPGLTAYSLNGEILPPNWMETTTDEVVILHTPGHSPGSISLYRRPSNDKPGILFTGDTYAWSTRSDGGCMTGFPRYGNNLLLQAETLEKLLNVDWQVIAPGHGHSRDYRHTTASNVQEQRQEELHKAQNELRTFRSQRAW